MHAETVATYDRIAGRFADQWWSTRLAGPMSRFARSLPAGGRVLDLGCGPGRDTAWLAEQGFTSIGLDASAGMLDEARTRVGTGDASAGGGTSFLRGDLVALPFASATADGAWVCASLLHLDPAATLGALTEVRRVLRPGGALFAGVQQGEGDTIKRSASGNRFFTYWSPVDFAAAVSVAGFEVETVSSDRAGDVRWVQVHAHRLGGGH
jgi:ubiquinone/menaquinone biosynthesis C-methylase UbiE